MRALAPVPLVADVVHAQQHDAAPERIDRPPASVILLHHAEEACRLVRDPLHEAVGCVGRKYLLRDHLRTRLGACDVDFREYALEPAVNVQARTAACDGGRAGARPSRCGRNKLRPSRRELVTACEYHLAGRILDLAADSRRIARENKAIRLAVAPTPGMTRLSALQLVNGLREPFSFLHLAQLEEVATRIPLVVRRRLHKREMPVVAAVVHERHAYRGPTVRAARLGPYQRGDRHLGGAFGLESRQVAKSLCAHAPDLGVERPCDRVQLPQGDGTVNGIGDSRHDGSQQREKNAFFHAASIPYTLPHGLQASHAT